MRASPTGLLTALPSTSNFWASVTVSPYVICRRKFLAADTLLCSTGSPRAVPRISILCGLEPVSLEATAGKSRRSSYLYSYHPLVSNGTIQQATQAWNSTGGCKDQVCTEPPPPSVDTLPSLHRSPSATMGAPTTSARMRSSSATPKYCPPCLAPTTRTTFSAGSWISTRRILRGTSRTRR